MLPGASKPVSCKHESALVEPVKTNESMEPKQWVGIDVSGKRLEVFVRPIQRMLKVANSPAGLAALLTAERNRLRAMTGAARADIETHIEWLEKRLVRLDEELERLIACNPVWKELSALLCSVPGVGPVVAATLIANLPELGSAPQSRLAGRPVAIVSLRCRRELFR